MVFLSTIATMFGHKIERAVFSFGARNVTQRIILEEVVMGLFTIVPLSILIAHLCIRFAAAGPRPSWVRSDLWTTLIITTVGDWFLEILLPSLQCYPLQDEQDELSYHKWMQQSWGMACPQNVVEDRLFSTDAVGTLLTVRLAFICMGVYLGESFVPVALTGGIATGKSTVGNLLVSPNNLTQTVVSPNSKKKKKAKSTNSPSGGVGNNSDEEGTVLLVDTDSIGHEILLPPHVLAQSNEYTVQPNDSVYNDIVEAFGENDILDENNLIDRRKLGAIIFQNPSQRRVLNSITHPRIIVILVKRLLRATFFSSQDIVCADVPLLFESGQLRWLFCLTIVVVCDPDKQLERLRQRNPDLSHQQCQDRIASQMPISKKVKMANIVIENNGDLLDLANRVEEVRRDVMGRLYGIGMSLLQMLLLVGGSLSLAVSSKLFTSWTE